MGTESTGRSPESRLSVHKPTQEELARLRRSIAKGGEELRGDLLAEERGVNSGEERRRNAEILEQFGEPLGKVFIEYIDAGSEDEEEARRNFATEVARRLGGNLEERAKAIEVLLLANEVIAERTAFESQSL